ncbi:RNA-binding S4 domain-containing protein [Prosthecomicrobium pneumaticum]|uniref:Ribosome-associated heat shock protein Hsp15 n=1 Tax=Prosthecomicrobium pneumaticum TaxID=81895 RepID=A0A7W9CV46_9HYPH|nr:RNA-binding S4 domain-containing protein [Prosthecomicrobium pneumaticum]MBB5752450.1 ribosome-associated heat shock protein Hsp15 [Prosthecomicrobium pneumaticum]
MTAGERQRIDKWLWFARFTKSRTGAQRLVEAGAVRVNREKVDQPSRLVGPGDVLTLVTPAAVRVVRIAACGGRRGPAEEARRLYEDVPASGEARGPAS